MSNQSNIRPFQTEVNQLLHLVVHSLYSNKEIFLRELISNASDACDKLRFMALNNKDLYGNDIEPKIHVDFNEAAQTITITDNGIGMSSEEVIENLGTIAKSGTREFLAHLTGDQSKDSQLIGQFGVGFYSGFIVADKITVRTLKAGLPKEEGVFWESTGEDGFEIRPISKNTRGTEVVLHLKEKEKDFLSDHRLRSLITKYSDHINWPITMNKVTSAEEGDEKKTVEIEEETVNRATALWASNKSDITEEQYNEFYKHISHDFSDPLAWTHNAVEGRLDYTSLLYIPSRAPFNLFMPEFKHGLKLYVKRVFIMDEAEQFLPRYLRFIKGVIDSSDLPLNISREILQENEAVETIRKACIKRILTLLEKLAVNEKDKYQEFWGQLGNVLKEGIIEDSANREQIAKLLRFASTQGNNDQQTVSLDEYIERMKEGQEAIYYLTAESYNTAINSPHLEIFQKKGIEVLLLTDRVDEWLVSHLTEYNEKPLKSIARGNLEVENLEDEKEKEHYKKITETHADFVKKVKTVLGDSVKEVRVTHRLTDSPACIVADENDMGQEMQRLLQAAGQNAPEMKPILELNPEHPMVLKIEKENDDDHFTAWARLLLDQAILAEGGKLDNPGQFVKQMNAMVLQLMDPK